MTDGRSPLLVFEEELEALEEVLKANVIRMANSREKPQNPLRPDKEITYDASGQHVLPNSRTGISLAASMRQLKRIWAPGMKKWLLAVSRNCPMPEGLALQPDNPHHWTVVVTRRMTLKEFETRIEQLITNWKLLGKYVRHE
jgi:hypothetical protein